MFLHARHQGATDALSLSFSLSPSSSPSPLLSPSPQAGFHTPEFLPVGRGFNTSYGFLAGGEDHYTQTTTQCEWGRVTDYWDTHAPAANCSVPAADRQRCPQWSEEQKASGGSQASRARADALCSAANYTNCAWDASAAPDARCFQCKPKRYTGFDFDAKAVALIEAHDAAE